MRKLGSVIVGSAALLAVVVGSGVAGAVNEYNGMTYADAILQIRNPVIASRVGEYLPTEKCIVSGSRTDRASGNTYLYLNCNAPSAMSGHPGNSVVTPQGQQDQRLRREAKGLGDDFAAATAAGKQSEAYCAKDFDACVNYCDKLGKGYCSEELRKFLGL